MHDVIPFALVVVVAALALLAAVGSSRISEWVRDPHPGHLPGRRLGLRRPLPRPRLAVDPRRPAHRHGRAGADPLRRRHAHRARPLPPGRRRRRLARGRRHLRHRRGARRARPPALRLRLARRPAARHRPRPDRPGGRLLGPRSPRGRRPDRDPAGGRVRRERPGRHRADAGDPRHQRRRLGRRRPRSRRSSRCRWCWASPSEWPAGLGLRWLLHHLPLPNEALYPLRTVAFALLVYGVTTARPRVRVPRRAAHRDPGRRHPRAVQARDRALRLGGRRASARSSRSPCSGCRSRSRRCSAAAAPGPGIALAAAADPRGPPGLRRAADRADPAAARRTRVRAVGRAQGRRPDPARHLRRGRGCRRAPTGSTP